MNEFEIRQALAGAAPAAMAPDPDRLRAALARADRMKNIRAAVVVGALSLVVSLGVFMSQAGESSTPLDVVDNPEVPAPDAGLPVLDDATTETTTVPPTTSTPLAPPEDNPDHLGSPTSTTAAPALITVTTTTLTPVTTTVPPTTTAPPTTTTAATSTFSASALYGSCEEPIPYDEYSGTAAPGATITVTSPWSTTGTVTADGNGDWWIRIEFPSAPVGEHFDVRVSDGAASADLDFVRNA